MLTKYYNIHSFNPTLDLPIVLFFSLNQLEFLLRYSLLPSIVEL